MKLSAPGRKFQFGASATVAFVAGALILVLVNYMAARHYRRWDWTSTGLYTLSDKSKQVLADVAAKKQEITVVGLMSQEMKLYDSVRELLTNYAASCPTLKLEFLDPASNPVRTEALLKEFGVGVVGQSGAVLFKCGERRKQVDVMDFVDLNYSQMDEMGGGEPPIKAFKGEQAFTGAILSVTQEKQTSIYFMKGHEEASADGQEESGLSQLTAVLKQENYRIADWDSPGQTKVPDDCDVLVIAGPHRTLLDSDAQAVEAFLKAGGRVLAMLDPEFTRETTVAPTGLEGVMKDYGVSLGANLVVDKHDPRIILLGAGMETLVLRDLPTHPVTRNLGGTAVVFRVARSVSETTPAPPALTVQPLARTSQDGWAANDIAALTKATGGIARGPNDTPGPVTVAEAVEQGSPEGDSTAEASKTSPAPKLRLVVFGDSDFATNGEVMRLGNLDLVLNAIHWLADKEALLGIEPRTPEQIVLTLDPTEARTLVLLVLLGLPGIAACAGLGVWWKRRS